jgi:hypothetical protein
VAGDSQSANLIFKTVADPFQDGRPLRHVDEAAIGSCASAGEELSRPGLRRWRRCPLGRIPSSL